MDAKMQQVVIPPGPTLRRSYRGELLTIPGKPVVVYAYGRSVYFYDVYQKSCMRKLACKNTIRALSIDESGRYLAVGDEYGSVEVLDLQTADFVSVLSYKYAYEVTAMAFSPLGELYVASKALTAYSFENEQQRYLATPVSGITRLEIRGVENAVFACATSFGGQVYFYAGTPLQFVYSYETHQQQQDCLLIDDLWYVFGAEGAVRVFTTAGKLLGTQKVAEMTIYAATIAELAGKKHIVCGTGVGYVILLSLWQNDYLNVKMCCSFGSRMYANAVVALTWNYTLQQLVAFSLSGKYISLSEKELSAETLSLDDRVYFITQTEPTYCQAIAGSVYRLGRHSAIVCAYDMTGNALLNEDAYEYLLPNDVVFVGVFDGVVRGFTTTEAFTIYDRRLHANALGFTLVAACAGDTSDCAVLFGAQKVYKYCFASCALSEVFSLPVAYRELTAACVFGAGYALALAPRRTDRKCEIVLCSRDFELGGKCDIFASVAFLQSIGALLFAGSSDAQFVAFKEKDFANDAPWPSYTRLDAGARAQGRINCLCAVSENPCVVRVCGERGVCTWEFADRGRLINTYTLDVPAVASVEYFIFRADGAVLRTDNV